MVLTVLVTAAAVALAYGAIMYRAGRSVEAACWRAEEAERERALTALAGGPRPALKVETSLRKCEVCAQFKPVPKLCEGCENCAGLHQHMECFVCHWKWIVQPP